jgi:hypothetical protein
MNNSKMPDLPEPDLMFAVKPGMSSIAHSGHSADQLRALQIATWNAAMEAVAAEMERQSAGITVGGTYANAMRSSYSRAATVVRSMKSMDGQEGER